MKKKKNKITSISDGSRQPWSNLPSSPLQLGSGSKINALALTLRSLWFEPGASPGKVFTHVTHATASTCWATDTNLSDRRSISNARRQPPRASCTSSRSSSTATRELVLFDKRSLPTFLFFSLFFCVVEVKEESGRQLPGPEKRASQKKKDTIVTYRDLIQPPPSGSYSCGTSVYSHILPGTCDSFPLKLPGALFLPFLSKYPFNDFERLVPVCKRPDLKLNGSLLSLVPG
ncbi:hypothetical protein VTO42DRAFT_5908 [Malbranchea cinnamomea]